MVEEMSIGTSIMPDVDFIIMAIRQVNRQLFGTLEVNARIPYIRANLFFFIGAEEVENGVIKAHDIFGWFFGRLWFGRGGWCGLLDRHCKQK